MELDLKDRIRFECVKMGKGILSKRKSMRKGIIVRRSREQESWLQMKTVCKKKKLRSEALKDKIGLNQRPLNGIVRNLTFSVCNGKPLKYFGAGQ